VRIEVLRENKQPPPELVERLARAGGRNRFGEPNFRVVWGWSRLCWIGGRWEDRDAGGHLLRAVVELRQVPKYIPHDRWHIERWLPPELYGSPEQWYRATAELCDGRRVPALGPYPARGDWEHCFTLATPDGGFLGLEPAVCDAVVRRIEYARTLPPARCRAALVRAQERRERDWHNWAEALLANEPFFHGRPGVAVPAAVGGAQ